MIWIETLSRHQDVVARQRCDADTATLGRAYDNDVVLDDPYAAAHHVEIARDADGRLVARDLGSVNGLYVGDGRERQAAVVLDGERVLRIGRTLVRVRDAAFSVPAERVAAPPARTWPQALALCVAVAVVSVVALWLAETTETQPSRYVLPLLAMAMMVGVWTTAWALMGRLFAGQARFERHLAIALIGLLAFFVFDELTDYGAFALSLRALADFAYIGNWAIFATVCFFHLREIAPARLPRKAGVVAALALAAIGAQMLARSEVTRMFGQQSYLPGLKPPMFRLTAPRSDDAFFADTDKLKAAVDRARDEPVEGPALVDTGDN
jgi:FHA domain